MFMMILDGPAEVGCDWSVNGRGDVGRTDGRTNQNYSMITQEKMTRLLPTNQ